MSTQTNHLGLHQWEPEDDFLRTDFNEDFGKIDAGVKTVADALTTEASARQSADSALNATLAALTERVEGGVVAGSYAMNNGTAVEIDLGFKPKLVILLTRFEYTVTTNTYRRTAMGLFTEGFGVEAYENYRSGYASSYSITTATVTFTDTGFRVSSGTSYNYKSVAGDDPVYYVAFR